MHLDDPSRILLEKPACKDSSAGETCALPQENNRLSDAGRQKKQTRVEFCPLPPEASFLSACPIMIDNAIC